MRKIKKEKKKVEVEKEVVTSNTLHCDICDKEIKGESWMVYTGEPVCKDICSKKCLHDSLDEYVKNKTPGAAFEIYFTKGV